MWGIVPASLTGLSGFCSGMTAPAPRYPRNPDAGADSREVLPSPAWRDVTAFGAALHAWRSGNTNYAKCDGLGWRCGKNPGSNYECSNESRSNAFHELPPANRQIRRDPEI